MAYVTGRGRARPRKAVCLAPLPAAPPPCLSPRPYRRVSRRKRRRRLAGLPLAAGADDTNTGETTGNPTRHRGSALAFFPESRLAAPGQHPYRRLPRQQPPRLEAGRERADLLHVDAGIRV